MLVEPVGSESTLAVSGDTLVSSPIAANGSGQQLLRDSFGGGFGRPLVPVLSLNSEMVLDTGPKRLVHCIVTSVSRCFPAFWCYGGTISLLICVIFKYRWGMLLALTLYNVYSCFLLTAMILSSLVGLVICWINTKLHWSDMWRRERAAAAGGTPGSGAGTPAASAQPLEADELGWDDVFHIVFVASYCTPIEVLRHTVASLAQVSQAQTNMGIVLALEEREKGVAEKAAVLRADFEGHFKFITATFHPPNMPNHIKGKASNMCWAFQDACRQLISTYGFVEDDQRRILITNMDDDSEFHINYFEALTYKFLKADVQGRYLSIWQPPICQVMNMLQQPNIIRISALLGSLSDLAKHANPLDCRTPFSSNSMSMVLALAVGGWDPDWLSDDWHMLAKCAAKTEGRCKCESIVLPLVNYTPQEDTVIGTLQARFTQAKRHSLGVSEVVYLASATALGLMEVPTLSRKLRMLWRILPLLSKFVEVHFVNSLAAVWPPLTNILILFASLDVSEDRVVFNSLLAQVQKRVPVVMGLEITMGTILAMVYFGMVRHRVLENDSFYARWLSCFWLRCTLDFFLLGWIQQLIYGSIPEWIAATRIVFRLKIDHAVAAMIGRPDMGEGF